MKKILTTLALLLFIESAIPIDNVSINTWNTQFPSQNEDRDFVWDLVSKILYGAISLAAIALQFTNPSEVLILTSGKLAKSTMRVEEFCNSLAELANHNPLGFITEEERIALIRQMATHPEVPVVTANIVKQNQTFINELIEIQRFRSKETLFGEKSRYVILANTTNGEATFTHFLVPVRFKKEEEILSYIKRDKNIAIETFQGATLIDEDRLDRIITKAQTNHALGQKAVWGNGYKEIIENSNDHLSLQKRSTFDMERRVAENDWDHRYTNSEAVTNEAYSERLRIFREHLQNTEEIKMDFFDADYTPAGENQFGNSNVALVNYLKKFDFVDQQQREDVGEILFALRENCRGKENGVHMANDLIGDIAMGTNPTWRNIYTKRKNGKALVLFEVSIPGQFTTACMNWECMWVPEKYFNMDMYSGKKWPELTKYIINEYGEGNLLTQLGGANEFTISFHAQEQFFDMYAMNCYVKPDIFGRPKYLISHDLQEVSSGIRVPTQLSFEPIPDVGLFNAPDRVEVPLSINDRYNNFIRILRGDHISTTVAEDEIITSIEHLGLNENQREIILRMLWIMNFADRELYSNEITMLANFAKQYTKGLRRLYLHRYYVTDATMGQPLLLWKATWEKNGQLGSVAHSIIISDNKSAMFNSFAYYGRNYKIVTLDPNNPFFLFEKRFTIDDGIITW